jgi:hypothetical protein
MRMDAMELVGVVPDDWKGESPPVDTGRLGRYLSQPGQTDNSLPDSPFAKGTPLDLYVFQDFSPFGATKNSQ